VQINSGYGSMPDKKPRVSQQDDDVVSLKSIITNGSRVHLPRHEEDHLISAFTGGLCQDIDLCGDIDALGRTLNTFHVVKFLRYFQNIRYQSQVYDA
jgi:hypothetical protein